MPFVVETSDKWSGD